MSLQHRPTQSARISRRRVLQTGAAIAGGILVEPVSALGSWSPQSLSGSSTSATSVLLRCEYLEQPLGLQNPQPRLSWTVVTPPDGRRQVAYQVQVSSIDGHADLWDSGRVDSKEPAVEYAGKLLAPHQQALWQVRTWYAGPELASGAEQVSPWSGVARWSQGPALDQDWEGSAWIGRDDLLESTQDMMPDSADVPKEPNFFPAPYLRTTFDVSRPIRSAVLYVCALGFGEIYLNGQRLGNAERDPGFTNFDRRLLYVTHDVTAMIERGRNAVGAILGTGWYDVHDVATWHFNTAPWRQRPRMRLTLVLEHTDGTRSYVLSGKRWRASAGPILRDGVYTGEVYDARREMPDWSNPAFDDKHWQPALEVEAPRGILVPMPCEPVRIAQTIVPVGISEPKPGVFLVDMGQNFSGHTQLRVRGPAGHAIAMRYAEVLNSDGTLNSQPIDHFMELTEPRQPFQQDTYICRGTGELEVWEQRFSWSGFQFVEVTNFPGTPTLENFRGRFAHTDLAPAGEFSCSDEVVRRIQAATRQSYLSNAQSYPTDCPQREKNGWTGDAGVAAETGLINFQSVAFYRKWLDDFADAQRPDGGLPVLVPNGGWGNGERWPGDVCPPWDAAYMVIAWQIYRHTGDKGILARHVDRLRLYVEFFLGHRRADGLAPALGIGDWSPWKTTAPQDFITNAYLYLDLKILARIYRALRMDAESQRYALLAQDIGQLVHKTFYSSTSHRYSNGSQMAQGTALDFGFVPEPERAAVFADLVMQVETLGYLDVGFLGAKYVTRALAEGGRSDLVFKVCCSRLEMPSYGYWVKTAGSTTLWEGWKAGPSYNHIMFGDISAWFYEWIAGVQQQEDSTGFEKIVFRPGPIGGLTEASASYLSPRGNVGCSWKLSGNVMQAELIVPQGSTARWKPQGGTAVDERIFGSGLHTVAMTLA